MWTKIIIRLCLINKMDLHEFQVQSTMKYWPNNAQLAQQIGIPLSLTFMPANDQNYNNASFNQKNIDKYRCQSCKAFLNKYCLVRNQNQYDCSLCGFSNHLETKINMNSAEMTFTEYKCKASKNQRTIISKERLLVFILDFSNYDQLSKKYLVYAIHAIKQFVNHAYKQKKNIKIMFIGFDDSLQIFNIKRQISRVVFWDDSRISNINQYPFNSEQIGLLNQCKQNIDTILTNLEQQIKQRTFRTNTSSKKIMEVIEYALKHTKTQSGKIFIVSGLNHELQAFKVMRNYDLTVQDSYKNHYPIVKKQCLSQNMQNLLNTTQMSISVFIHKANYSNLMPFHVIVKSTNGQLRHYFKNQTDHFFYQFNFLIHQSLYDMKFQTLLRIRSGIGLKLMGIFGNYRPWKGVPQQVQLLSCQNNRKLVLQFVVQGKISSPLTVVQFSVLYTDLQGNRYCKTITHMIELTSQISLIIPQINYQIVNFTYLRAVLHNMDITSQFRKLQLVIQQRCKKHLRKIRQIQSQKNKLQVVNSQQLIELDFMKNARTYIIFTFMLMKHFLLNITDKRDIYLDLNAQARSKIATHQDSLRIIWPLLFIITQKGYQIIEMKFQNFQFGTLGVVIDRGDQIYVFIKSNTLRNTIKSSRDYKQSIKQCSELQNIYKLLQQIEENKNIPHLDIIILEPNYVHSFDLFSRKGSHSFQNFVEALLQN